MFTTATSGRYTQSVNVSFVADVRAMQSALEQSGKFEGDIMLTDEQLRIGFINPVRHWPNGEVPFVIDSVFGEYCSPKLKVVRGAWREISCIMSTASAPVHTGVGAVEIMEIITSVYTLKNHKHTQSHFKPPCKQIHDPQSNITSKCLILLNKIKIVMLKFNVRNLTSTTTVICSRSLPVTPLYCKTAQPPYNIA